MVTDGRTDGPTLSYIECLSTITNGSVYRVAAQLKIFCKFKRKMDIVGRYFLH